MRATLLLTRRAMRLFGRDPAAVFFSILSSLILIGLYALFLGSLQVTNLQNQLPDADPDDIRAFVNSWVFAGTAMIATVSTPLAALAVFVDDNATGRFADFLVSPVKRAELVGGYLLASLFVGVALSMSLVGLGQLYLLTQGQPTMTGANWLHAFAYVALSCAAFAAIASFGVSFLRSAGAFASLSTVVGSLIGFLAGAYIPPGTLADGVVNAMNALPFAQSAMLIRRPLVDQAVERLTAGNDDARTALQEFYGVTIGFHGEAIPPAVAVFVLAGLAIAFTLLGVARIRRAIR